MKDLQYLKCPNISLSLILEAIPGEKLTRSLADTVVKLKPWTFYNIDTQLPSVEKRWFKTPKINQCN